MMARFFALALVAWAITATVERGAESVAVVLDAVLDAEKAMNAR